MKSLLFIPVFLVVSGNFSTGAALAVPQGCPSHEESGGLIQPGVVINFYNSSSNSIVKYKCKFDGQWEQVPLVQTPQNPNSEEDQSDSDNLLQNIQQKILIPLDQLTQ